MKQKYRFPFKHTTLSYFHILWWYLKPGVLSSHSMLFHVLYILQVEHELIWSLLTSVGDRHSLFPSFGDEVMKYRESSFIFLIFLSSVTQINQSNSIS